MPTETQAWVVEKESGPFVLHDVTLDDPLEDEVLVQLSAPVPPYNLQLQLTIMLQ